MFSIGKNKKSIKNLKKFRSAKFNYAKFVKKYYIEKGTAYISAKVSSVDDIISKYSTKDYEWINPDFAHYIEECAYYIPIDERITIEICDGHFSDEEKELIQRVIKDYFGLKLGDKFLDLQTNKYRSLILLAFGVISSIIFILLNNFKVISALNEFIIFLIWFFIWEYADLAWLNAAEIQSQRLEAGQLSTAKITFLDNVEANIIEKNTAEK